ncbi:MAG TPA: hypothetical protein VGW74_09320 [Propionibacteriaceae bacterium]|nr:hypothetical protein [Propionibacteriaceae bacterium]
MEASESTDTEEERRREGRVLLWSESYYGHPEFTECDTVEEAAAVKAVNDWPVFDGAEDFTGPGRRWVDGDELFDIYERVRAKEDRERQAAEAAVPIVAEVVVAAPTELDTSHAEDQWAAHGSYRSQEEAEAEADRLRAICGADRVVVRPPTRGLR